MALGAYMSFIYEAKILPYYFRILVTLTFTFLDVCPICMAGTDMVPPPPTPPPSGGACDGNGRAPYNWQQRWIRVGERTFYLHAEDEEILQLLSQQLEQQRNAGALLPGSMNWIANLYPSEWIPRLIRRLMIRYPNGVTIFSAGACFAGMIAYCRYRGISGPLSPLLQGAGSAALAHMMFFVNLCPSSMQRPLIVGSVGASVTNTICRNAIAYHRSILQSHRTTVLYPQVIILATQQGQSQILNSDQDIIVQANAIDPDDDQNIDDTQNSSLQTSKGVPTNCLRRAYPWLMSLFYHR